MYIIGFPRSGNTWFCYLVAYCLNTEYDDADAPGIHPRDEYQRKFVKGGLIHASFSGEVGKVLKTHKHSPVKLGEPVIYLVRDPRDVMVSYWYYLNAKREGDIRIENNQSEFTGFIKKHLPEWNDHIIQGLNLNPQIIVRYEDLLKLPVDTLHGVFRLLNVNVNSDVIRHALDIFDFNKLSQRKTGENNERAFFRKGISGDWKENLAADDLKLVLNKTGDVIRALGYEQEPVQKEKPQPTQVFSQSQTEDTAPQNVKKNEINEGFLEKQREFWNVNNMQDAMFKRIVTDPEILRLSPEEQEKRWEQSVANSLNRLLKELPHVPSWTVLDIGCGIGRCIKPLRKIFSRVDGVDIAETMVRMAQNYLADASGEGRVIINNGKDLHELKDDDYNLVYSMLVFQHIRSLSVVKNYFREVRRVLKPGGFFRVQVADASMPKMGSFNEEADPDKQYGLFGNSYTSDQLRGLMHEHGFVDVEVLHEGQWLWATGVKPLIVKSGDDDETKRDSKIISENLDLSGILAADTDIVRSLDSRTKENYHVSSIVSVYKSVNFLRGLFEDLTAQTLYKKNELEIVIVDSASPDNDWQMIEDFVRNHPHIRAVRTGERETLYTAWNRAVKESRGTYISNANTDDRHKNDALEVLSAVLDKTAYADLVYGNSYYSRIENETFEQNDHSKLLTTPVYFAPTLALHFPFGPHPLWRKTLHDKIGNFDGSFTAAGDWDFALRLGMKCRAVHISDVVGLYLWRGDAISYRDDAMKSENQRIYSLYHNPETIEALYAAEGVALDTTEQKARVYLDIGVRAMQYIRPDGVFWRRLSLSQKCFDWAAKATPGWIAPHNNIALILASQDNLPGASSLLQKLADKTDDRIAKYNLSSINRMIQTGRRDAPLQPMLSGLPFPPQTEFFHQSTNGKGAKQALAEMV